MYSLWNKLPVWTAAISCAALLLGTAFWLESCSKNESVEAANSKVPPVSITNGGDDVSFPPNAPQLRNFALDTVREAALTLTVSAPVHNLVSIVKSELAVKKLYLFETQDLTDTYSNYVTAVAALDHSSLALERTRDLFAHNIAAARDLQDAEQDYATEQATLADNDAKLRAAGIDPKELNASQPGTVWAVADVPEEQVTSIKPGMKVEIEYIEYPNQKFSGQLASIGEAVDPATRKVKVRIVVANTNNELHTAMFGTASFIGTSQRAVTVPTTAVVREGDGTMSAWTTTDGHRFTRHTVTIGLQEDGHYQITAGLMPGEEIVTSGGVFLSNMNDVGE